MTSKNLQKKETFSKVRRELKQNVRSLGPTGLASGCGPLTA